MDTHSMFLVLVIVVITAIETVVSGLCTLWNLPIKNGNHRLQSGNSVARYSCNAGYQLYGPQKLICFGANWSSDPPICIANTCPGIEPTSTLRIKETYEGAVLKFSCAVSYKLQGADLIICDGDSWNDTPPTCIAWTPPKSCDFESSDLCGWSHHEMDNQDWRWNTGKTMTTRTGPDYDHTLGKYGNGHYMYFESSSPSRLGHNAILVSPLYPASSNKQCFKFWYHTLGVGDISQLEVFVTPDGGDISGLNPVFVVDEDMGKYWQFHAIDIGTLDDAFQIMFVATRGSSYRSDTAIDDVALYDCPKTATTVQSSGTTPTQITTLPVSKSTTRTEQTTRRQTTSHAVTDGVTSSATQQLTTAVKTSQSTDKKSTPSQTTRRQTTSQAVTNGVTSSATHQLTTAVKTSQSTDKKSTPSQTITRTPTTEIITSSVKHTMKPTLISSTAKRKYTPSLSTSLVTRVNGSITPTTARINPNVPGVNSSKLTADSGHSSLLYILVGVGIVLVCVIVVVVFYFVKIRKPHRMTLASMSSDNPLYMVMASDEPTVHFAQEEGYDNLR